MLKIRILHEPTEYDPFLVIDKPAGLPSAPIKEDDDSALTQSISIFPKLNNVYGKKIIERGLLHRIDTATRGLLLIAASQEAYDSMIKCQSEGKFIKYYKAEVDCNMNTAGILGGFPPQQEDFLAEDRMPDNQFSCRISSFFRPYGLNGKCVRPVTDSSGKAALKKAGTKLYTTDFSIKETTAVCKIKEGYRHQVRCHLAWCGFPIKGDNLYNPFSNKDEQMRFEAFRIEFIHPYTGKSVSYEI